MSSFIAGLYLYQGHVYEIDQARNYFFGVFDADWSTIFQEMFSKNLDTIHIQNNHHPEYLSLNDANALINVRLSLTRSKKTLLCRNYQKVRRRFGSEHPATSILMELTKQTMNIQSEVFDEYSKHCFKIKHLFISADNDNSGYPYLQINHALRRIEL